MTEVSICIPAWMAESFIERTVGYAAAQTHAAVRILISVDAGRDATAALCRQQADRDDRIVVFEQPERLGWAANVNFLLEQVRTPCFFLYFHDDVILPRYTATLLERLEARPDAVSIHCDMAHFGGGDHVSVGRAYEGSAVERLMTFLLAPDRGSPLRSLTRSSVLDRLRMPTSAVGGLWANEPYLMRLLAAGPALHLPEQLYRRWDQRKGSLTDGWKSLSPEVVLSGYKANIVSALEVIDEAATTGADREALIFGLFVNMVPLLRHVEREAGVSLFATPAELTPAFARVRLPEDIERWGASIAGWATQRYHALPEADRRG